MKIRNVMIDILGGRECIGGNIILIEHNNLKVCLDIGIPLDESIIESIDKDDLRKLLQNVDYCFVSHAHQDHWGYMDLLPDSCIIYSGRETQTLIRITRCIARMPFVKLAWHNFRSEKSVYLGSFVITPFLIDHSAYDAYAFHISVCKVSILYTGDIRFHGRKMVLSQNLSKRLKKVTQNRQIDLLITEGTNLSGTGVKPATCRTESGLEQEFEKVFSSHEKPVIIQMSGQNLDRLVTIYRACLKTGRWLILDPYTAFVASRLKTHNIPELNQHWDISVLLPEQEHLWNSLGLPAKKVQWMSPFSVDLDDLRKNQHYVLLFRYWIGQAIDAKDILPDGSSFIYSMSSYYLDKTEKQWGGLAKRINEGELTFYNLHVSGHSYPEDLKIFIDQINPRFIFPVHTQNNEWFRQYDSKLIAWEDEVE